MSSSQGVKLFGTLILLTAVYMAFAAPQQVHPSPSSQSNKTSKPKTPPKSSKTAKKFASSPSPSSTPSLPKVEHVVAKVQSFYDKVQTFKSKFVQKFWAKAYRQEKKSWGTVIFKKPGKMLWLYEHPKGNRILYDGKELHVVEASNQQIYDLTLDQSQLTALSFLMGRGELRKMFDFELFSGERMNFPGGLVLAGTPQKPSAIYQKVLFYIDQKTSQIRRVMILDGQGNRNRFDFEDPHVNEPINPTQFVFVPPAGMERIRP